MLCRWPVRIDPGRGGVTGRWRDCRMMMGGQWKELDISKLNIGKDVCFRLVPTAPDA